MLTPAEELGLSGMSLNGRVRTSFQRLDPRTVSQLFSRIHEECLRRHVVYMRDGQADTVHLLPCPVTLLPDQLAYVHYVCLVLHNTLKQLPDLYLSDPAVREALCLPPDEESWLRECWGAGQQENNPVFGRLDAVADFSSPMWKDSLRFVEPNMSGIGGLHLAPTCEQIVAELVFPLLRDRDQDLKLEMSHDIRELLMQEMLDHLEAIGRGGRTVCFVEPRFATSGIDEQVDLARFYRERHGIIVLHADPTELSVAGNDVQFQGTVVDLAYRDYSVADVLALQREGHDVEPMRRLFRENRMVSSIAAELDQKSCWEVFTDPKFHRYFTSEQRHVFRRHVPWTRILAPRETALPDGTQGDLLEFVTDEREILVLKPNRSFGGQGVLIGLATEPAAWEQAVQAALVDENRWVVQQLVSIPVQEFPILDDRGAVSMEPFHVVLGFAPSKYGVAILARASQKQVVNIAQRGGMCAVALGHPPGRLIGPAR